MNLVHAAACVALFLLVQATSGSRLRQNEDARALVVVDHPQCTGDCAANTREAPDAAAKQTDAVPEFVPTHKWKDILPNQALPPGLYIRINMETGKKEAKLLN
ncbi:hypothetical protein Gpo141_00000546 [Globisporangium polare]